MYADWVHEDNVKDFIALIAQFCKYEFTEADADAVFYGVETTDDKEQK